MSSPLIGAWERESDTWQGLIVCTETHYSHTFMSKGRQPFGNEAEPSEAEEAEAYRTLLAGAGSYPVQGSTVTFGEETNRNPSGIGRPGSLDFTIEGDRLTTVSPRDGTSLTFRKVS